MHPPCQEGPLARRQVQAPRWLPVTFAEVRCRKKPSLHQLIVFLARKTKCDGAHPACSSCARRSLPCNYNHDSNNGASKKGSRRASLSSKVPPNVVTPSVHSPPIQSPPSSTIVGDVRYQNSTLLEDTAGELMDVDLKRKIDDMEPSQIQKRMRVDESIGHIIP